MRKRKEKKRRNEKNPSESILPQIRLGAGKKKSSHGGGKWRAKVLEFKGAGKGR
jgi:hypothetical protein